MARKIYQVWYRDDDLLYVTDVCKCNGRLFVETLSEPPEVGKWVGIEELTKGGWDEFSKDGK